MSVTMAIAKVVDCSHLNLVSIVVTFGFAHWTPNKAQLAMKRRIAKVQQKIGMSHFPDKTRMRFAKNIYNVDQYS
jgi:hypothetical protein